MKRVHIEIALTESVHSQVEKAAKALGLPVNKFLSDCVESMATAAEFDEREAASRDQLLREMQLDARTESRRSSRSYLLGE